MNFISTFDELNKLYEEVSVQVDDRLADEVEEPIEEACIKEELTEAITEEAEEFFEDEVPDEEEPSVEEPVEDAEIEIVDDEPRQVIIECNKCGALVIIGEADIKADKETDLVNVEDTCKFCEETTGYNIIGAVAPYEAVEVTQEEATEDTTVEEA